MKVLKAVLGVMLLVTLAMPVWAGLRAPTEKISIPVGTPIPAGSYQEEIGSVAVMSHENITRVDDIYACDPLSNYGLLMDTTGKVAELHYVHEGFEKETEYVWKVNVGSQRSGVPTIEYVAQSYTTRTQQTLFRFEGDGYIWTEVNGTFRNTGIEYPDLLTDAGQCPNRASALEIKIRMYPENGVFTLQAINRGVATRMNKLLGPYPLVPEISTEGLDRCIVKARPDSGTSYMDGVICLGSSLPLAPPELGGQVINRR